MEIGSSNDKSGQVTCHTCGAEISLVDEINTWGGHLTHAETEPRVNLWLTSGGHVEEQGYARWESREERKGYATGERDCAGKDFPLAKIADNFNTPDLGFWNDTALNSIFVSDINIQPSAFSPRVPFPLNELSTPSLEYEYSINLNNEIVLPLNQAAEDGLPLQHRINGENPFFDPNLAYRSIPPSSFFSPSSQMAFSFANNPPIPPQIPFPSATSSLNPSPSKSIMTNPPIPPASRPFAYSTLNCNRSYKCRAELLRHQRTHSDVAPQFPCGFSGCKRAGENGFLRKDHLRQHLRCRHGVNA